MASRTVLVVDSTGRGHALCDLFTRTNPDTIVYYAPGCALIREERIRSVPGISLKDSSGCLRFLEDMPVDLTVVSHIDALSAGFVDELRATGHAVIGPTCDSTRLETSKAFGKEFCVRHGIPVADYWEFTDAAQARSHVLSKPEGCVVKTDGLTNNGDGSVVCYNPEQARRAIESFMANDPFRVIVEQRLSGVELSVLALIDGHNYLLFPTALDYKRALDYDRGPNCDGMGSVAPHPFDSNGLCEEISNCILDPFINGIRAEGFDYTGFVYVGTMITSSGLKVLEINVRFGDSEAEVILPSIQNDFTELCDALSQQRLVDCSLRPDPLTRCSVALVQGALDPDYPNQNGGWPFGNPTVGQPVDGYESIGDACQVFFANITRDAAGRAITSGGRVLHVVGKGDDLPAARAAAYEGVRRIDFPGKRFRTDIGVF